MVRIGESLFVEHLDLVLGAEWIQKKTAKRAGNSGGKPERYVLHICGEKKGTLFPTSSRQIVYIQNRENGRGESLGEKKETTETGRLIHEEGPCAKMPLKAR